jgi:hypothetical protein
MLKDADSDVIRKITGRLYNTPLAARYIHIQGKGPFKDGDVVKIYRIGDLEHGVDPYVGNSYLTDDLTTISTQLISIELFDEDPRAAQVLKDADAEAIRGSAENTFGRPIAAKDIWVQERKPYKD